MVTINSSFVSYVTEITGIEVKPGLRVVVLIVVECLVEEARRISRVIEDSNIFDAGHDTIEDWVINVVVSVPRECSQLSDDFGRRAPALIPSKARNFSNPAAKNP